MKRDIDLARALLLDIEREGIDCPINRLRVETTHELKNGSANGATETSEVVRYHLRLLIDAGMVKEIDRTSSGVPCVRLTHAGHELVELSRSDTRWRDAKQLCRETTGGLSMVVIRSVLIRWAVEGAAPPPVYRGRRAYRPAYTRVAPRRRPTPYRYEYRGPRYYTSAVEGYTTVADEETRVARPRPVPTVRDHVRNEYPRYDYARYEPLRYEADGYDYPRYDLERSDLRNRFDLWDADRDYVVADRYEYPTEVESGDASLPVYLV
ncbi:MAG: DUF2513 domain-containing protein [Planctomycetota bacterium]